YLGVAAQEFGLTKYLVQEVLKDFDDRVEALREYVPSADGADWETVVAGQRVQVIKPAAAPRFGSLEFCTTLINNPEGSIAGLLGASPGASIAPRSEEHTSELQSRFDVVCRRLLVKKYNNI